MITLNSVELAKASMTAWSSSAAGVIITEGVTKIRTRCPLVVAATGAKGS